MGQLKLVTGIITFGPKEEVDNLVGKVFAHELMEKGYRRTSNAYCCVSRIDRDDWLDVMAKDMRCSRADFYNMDGTGIGDRWRDQYVRVYSKDSHHIHPSIYKHMKRFY